MPGETANSFLMGLGEIQHNSGFNPKVKFAVLHHQRLSDCVGDCSCVVGSAICVSDCSTSFVRDTRDVII